MVGKTLAHYQIVEKLGEGGMGVVWKARDTHLDRIVALKLLPPERLSDLGRKQRFVQEAKAASALNHPNIITVHDIADAEGTPFIVMEYVQGKTLDHLIGRKGLKLSTALDYAVQIAAALAKAHSVGIVHRDLKPSNIMISDGGLVKVLDFGLAKLTDPADSNDGTHTRTLAPTGKHLTEEGYIVGTAAYMSPEQAQGKPVDARSDVFSFGSVLYEMVTGRQAFQRNTNISTLSAIVDSEPQPIHDIRPDVPREIESIVKRCMRKDLDRRIQHLSDLKLTLEELHEQSESYTLTTAPAPKRDYRRRWAGAALVGSVAIAALVWFEVSDKKQTPGARTLPVTSYPGVESQPSLSPDGKQVAFVWGGGTQDRIDIYVKLVDAGSPLRLTNHAGVHTSPAWSPDGRHIAFVRQSETESGIFMIPALGGPERRIADLPPSTFPELAWSPDGKQLILAERDRGRATGGLFSLSVDTGKRQSVTEIRPPENWAETDGLPAFSPDGRTVAFVRMRGPSTMDLFTIVVRPDGTPGGEPKRLTHDERSITGVDWTADGRDLVFSSNRDGSRHLWRIDAAGGSPERLAATGEDVYEVSIARQTTPGNSRLVYARRSFDTNIWRIDAVRGGTPTRLIASTQDDYHPAYSPDGKSIAFGSKRSGYEEIWVSHVDGSNPAQLTFEGGPTHGCPRWSPDNRRIAFDSRRAGDSDIYVIDVSGGSPRRLTTESSDEVRPSWSSDGQRIYFASNRKDGWQIWYMSAQGGAPTQVTRNGGREAFESSDGRYLYYAKATAPGVWKLPVKGGEELLVSRYGWSGMWAAANEGIYALRTDTPTPELDYSHFATRKESRIAEFSKHLRLSRYSPSLSLSPDGLWILYGVPDLVESDILMVENFRP
jgi:eukaryotic-like serine/threonine-protein kinase